MKRTTLKKLTAWAGLSRGRIVAFTKEDYYTPPANQLEIFTSRKAARARYQHVEKVEITFVETGGQHEND